MEDHDLTGFIGRFRPVINFDHENIKPASYRRLILIFQVPDNAIHSGVSLDRFGKNFLAHQGIQTDLNRRIPAQIDHEIDRLAISGDIRFCQSAYQQCRDSRRWGRRCRSGQSGGIDDRGSIRRCNSCRLSWSDCGRFGGCSRQSIHRRLSRGTCGRIGRCSGYRIRRRRGGGVDNCVSRSIGGGLSGGVGSGTGSRVGRRIG